MREIGSSFWLLPDDIAGIPRRSLKIPNILNAGESYVSTCRSAIGIALDLISSDRKVALLPSFTCESVLAPFIKRGYLVEPYPIGLDLNIHWEDFKNTMEKVDPSVILLHPFFGFDTTSDIRQHIQEIREREIIIIEDMTQSMFSSFTPLKASFHVGSIRKWLPLPDGAFITAPVRGVEEEDDMLVQAKLDAMIEKGIWITSGTGDKSTFRRHYSDAESILDSREAPYLMSSISRELYFAFDIEKMKELRWMNYYYLQTKIWNSETLSDAFLPLLPPIDGKVCPFHFPVLVKEKRKDLQRYLASKDIYATVIWGIPEAFKDRLCDNAQYIYDHIICFHVDQRYSSEDMERIVNVLNQYYSN